MMKTVKILLLLFIPILSFGQEDERSIENVENCINKDCDFAYIIVDSTAENVNFYWDDLYQNEWKYNNEKFSKLDYFLAKTTEGTKANYNTETKTYYNCEKKIVVSVQIQHRYKIIKVHLTHEYTPMSYYLKYCP